MIKLLEKRLDIKALQEDLRKIGLAFVSSGIISVFLQHLLNLKLAIWIVIVGSILWYLGLTQKRG